jgi:hypothetical protein
MAFDRKASKHGGETMRQYLRDSNGRLIGWREEGMVGRINGRNDAGRLVGWFDPARNETRDANGRLVGRGDLLATLML